MADTTFKIYLNGTLQPGVHESGPKAVALAKAQKDAYRRVRVEQCKGLRKTTIASWRNGQPEH